MFNEIVSHFLPAATSDGLNPGTLQRLPDSDWDHLIEETRRHGVTALLYDRWRSSDRYLPIPPVVLERMRKLQFCTAVRNFRLLREAATIAAELGAQGIPTILLKGVHLAAKVYDNVSLRPMCDVDLLVRRDDLSEIDRLLCERSYIPAEQNSEWMTNYRHVGYLSSDRSVSIQFHWVLDSPNSPYHIDYQALWKRARSSVIHGVETLTLCPVDLVLHLCLHGSRLHFYDFGLRTLFDVSESIVKYGDPFAWRELSARAASWGCTRCVYLTLRMAKQLVSAPIPPDALAALEPESFDERLVDWARDRILAGPRGDSDLQGIPSGLAQAVTGQGVVAKLARFVRFAFPPRRTVGERYRVSPKSWSLALYYLVHLKDLGVRVTPFARRLVGRDEKLFTAAQQTVLRDWLAVTDSESASTPRA